MKPGDATLDRSADRTSATERVRRYYAGAAGEYDLRLDFAERFIFGNGRAWVCQRAQGDVLEIAVGTGRNLSYYPRDVRLTGIDLTPEMLAVARQRAEALGRDIDLRIGDAESLDFPDASFDTVVVTLGLCTIPNPQAAVLEASRVLRPGGRLLLWEHVRSPLLPVRLFQRLLNPVCVRWHADHLLREPLDYLRPAGFTVEHVERHALGVVERVVARRPG
jgi:ubiquinone/menaquinone biosynthesis C-methylase UbiE